MRSLDVNKIWKFVSKTMAIILGTTAEKQLKQWKHCKKHCFLVSTHFLVEKSIITLHVT